jgi:hypothetical protein
LTLSKGVVGEMDVSWRPVLRTRGRGSTAAIYNLELKANLPTDFGKRSIIERFFRRSLGLFEFGSAILSNTMTLESRH